MVNDIEITLRGYVGHEPALTNRPDRQSYLRLNVASTPRMRTREGEWVDGATQWFTVKFFSDFAEHVCHSVRKGDAVLVRGRLEHEEYDTRDGQQRQAAVILADAFGPDLRMATAHVTRAIRRSDDANATAAEQGEETAEQAADEATDAAQQAPAEEGDGDAESGPVDVSGFSEVPEEDELAAIADQDSMVARVSA